MKMFDISPERCKKFGFYSGDRVKTPKGLAWVVGVHGKDLYFQIDGEKGASKWSEFRHAQFSQRNFQIVHSPARSMLKYLKSMYNATPLKALVNDPDFSDICFVLDSGERVHAIKGMLVKRSSYFKALFNHRTQESELKEIRMSEIDKQSFLDILTYIYTGFVKVDGNNCFALVKAADLLLLEDLKLQCAKILKSQVTVESVMNILSLAKERSLDNVKTYCLQFLSDHYNSNTIRRNFKTFIKKDTADIVMEVFDYCTDRQYEHKRRKRKRANK